MWGVITMIIDSLSDLAKTAKEKGEKAVVAVVEAHDEYTIESVVSATDDGIMRPILIGDVMKIRELISKIGAYPLDYEMISTDGSGNSLRNAVELIQTGEASALMKGSIDTAELLKAVLNERNDLISGGRLSLAGIFETPNYHKLLAVSDIVVNSYPDFECKRAIVENAVMMLNTLGYTHPKVAVLTAIEKINPKMPETVDANALKLMNLSGRIENCVVEGPISFDLVTSAEAAIIKGYDSPVAGDADLLIVPDIASGNILAKCLTGMAGAQTAGAILGAKVPIVLTSRSALASDKYYSIALAVTIGSPAIRDY